MAIGFRPRNRDPEIADAHEPVVVDQDVRRLEIAMQHALRVRRSQARAQLPPDVDDLLRRQPAHAPKQRREILAPDQLHREEDHALGLADVEDPADGRVRDLTREPHFVEDPLARGRTGRLDDFQCDRGFEDEVVGAPDIAHAAAADALDHAIPACEYLAWREHRMMIRRGAVRRRRFAAS